jgi:hypothetical protein
VYGWRKLCSVAEDRVDQLALSHGITFRDPADLTLADCVRRFVTFDRSASTLN